MATQQPEWKCIGHIGDVDPIAHGGGFIYLDSTGGYGPEMTWFEPGPDEEWNEKQGETKLKRYQIMLQNKPDREWWWEDLKSLAEYSGQSLAGMQRDAQSRDLKVKALVYESLIRYYGAENFDSYPVEMTEDEAYSRYAEEMKMSLGR